MSKINIKGGTPSGWASLCTTCSWAHILSGFRESELLVICTEVNPNFITGLNGEIAFLAVSAKGIFWADWGSRGSGTTIGHANLDGTGVNQSFITGTDGGFGIAVTKGNP